VISPNPTTGATINPNDLASFTEGINRAGQLESTCDTCADVPDGLPVIGLGELDPIFPQFHTNSNGLGARHNAEQCFLCHAQPSLGGSGGFLVPNPGQATPMLPENPQFRLVPHRFGKQNIVPSFEQQYSPIREVRFKYKPDGTRDGGVHQLWVVTGINNDPTINNCGITQPDFAAQQAAGNLSFRIPLQMLGLGLIDAIQDREILSHRDATATQRAALGITGIQIAVAMMGRLPASAGRRKISRSRCLPARPTTSKWGLPTSCFRQRPKRIRTATARGSRNRMTSLAPILMTAISTPLTTRCILADWMQFSLLMRFTDGPQPDPDPTPSARRGNTVFSNIGCALCHTPQMQTAPLMDSAVLENRPVNLFSDLLVHHMGPGLADDIIQGAAGPDEFRTVPLCGGSGSVYSSCMTGGPATCLQRSMLIALRPRPSSPPRRQMR
jgi:hypothetical protein